MNTDNCGVMAAPQQFLPFKTAGVIAHINANAKRCPQDRR